MSCESNDWTNGKYVLLEATPLPKCLRMTMSALSWSPEISSGTVNSELRSNLPITLFPSIHKSLEVLHSSQSMIFSIFSVFFTLCRWVCISGRDSVTFSCWIDASSKSRSSGKMSASNALISCTRWCVSKDGAGEFVAMASLVISFNCDLASTLGYTNSSLM